MATSKLFAPEMVDNKDIIFTKDSNYQKQKEKEKKNPIFKRNKSKKSKNTVLFLKIIAIFANEPKEVFSEAFLYM